MLSLTFGPSSPVLSTLIGSIGSPGFQAGFFSSAYLEQPGIEPGPFCLQSRCSVTLSYRPSKLRGWWVACFGWEECGGDLCIPPF